MKQQLTPYIFPLVAILIVFFLVFRWYRMNTQNPGLVSDFGEQVQVQDLTSEERNSILRGTDDVATIALQPEGEATATGEVRYDHSGERVLFSVSADLPPLTEGVYQVWLRDTTQQSVKPVFTLEANKGGYLGSSSLSSAALPVEVVVSQETTVGEKPTRIIMTGTIPREETAE